MFDFIVIFLRTCHTKKFTQIYIINSAIFFNIQSVAKITRKYLKGIMNGTCQNMMRKLSNKAIQLKYLCPIDFKKSHND